MGLPLEKTRQYTYGDYLTWPDDVRYELIDGQAYAMPPAPTLDHQEITGEVFYQLKQQLEGKPCRVFISPVDVRLPRKDEANEAINTVVQPDVIMVCDPGKLDRRGVRGAPDWVLEVLSPSTALHDQLVKRKVYERVGVKEYWLIHPIDRTVTIYTLEQDRYGNPEISGLTGETALLTQPEIIIRWDALVQRLCPPDY